MEHPIQHVVVIKLSAWAEAWDEVKAAETVAFSEAVTRALRSSAEGSSRPRITIPAVLKPPGVERP